jgi:uncharacterized iron-regulated membrane protein
MIKYKKARDTIFTIHRYLGLVLGILIAIAGLTGSVMIVLSDTENFFIAQRIETIVPQGDRLSLEVLVEKAKAAYSTQGYSNLLVISPYTFPNHPETSPAGILLSKPQDLDDYVDVLINPYSGKVLGLAAPRNIYEIILNLHYALLTGETGTIIMGITGGLGFILMISGIILWPGWHKFTNGFKIRWNGHIKRLNFDIHKVAGFIGGSFLAMALITGFTYNFPKLAYPLIYQLAFSPIPPEEFTSTPIPNQDPVTLTQALNAIDLAMPEGIFTQIDIPQKPEDVFKVRKKVPGDWYGNPTWGRSFAHVDRYSGQVLSAINITKASLGEKISNGMDILHEGKFGGIWGRVLYFCVGIMPTVLFLTGFMMWRHRKKGSRPRRNPE